MAKCRCQHNILWILGEIITFSSFICLKASVFLLLFTGYYLALFFIYRFIEYFKPIKYPVNENFILIFHIKFLSKLTVWNVQVLFVTRSSLFCPKTKKSFSIFDLNRLSWRLSYTSKLVSKNYFQEIWRAICTISNIKLGVAGASLNFRTQKLEKMPLELQ